jgi:predicted HicB family RNase H-like nuclease
LWKRLEIGERAMINKEKQIARQNEFIRQSYDRVGLTLPKGYKEKIKAMAEAEGKSINAWIIGLIDNEIDSKN